MPTRVLIPSGALGLGYDAEALARGIAAKPDLIAIDGGSTNSGPSYLGRGVSKYAPDQTTANALGKLVNPYLLHHPLTLEEEVPTFAFPFSPAEVDRGAAYEFVLHHVMELAHPMDAFRLEVTHV